MNALEILEFKPFAKNTLRGFLTVRLPSGWEIRDISIHEKNGSRWLGMPSKSFKKEDGTTGWVPIVKMPDRARWEVFQKAVLDLFIALDSISPKEQARSKETEILF